METLPARRTQAPVTTEYWVWHKGLGRGHADAEDIATARLIATAYSESVDVQVHVMRHTAGGSELVGWAYRGVGHGAVA